MCRNEHVYVVGGGNSAGQAVMHLAAHAAHVTMLVRGPDLASSLSAYLIERIQDTANVDVRFNVEVTALDGDTVLRRVELKDTGTDESAWVDTKRLFVCIGGVPHTEWAKDTAIIRDRQGFLVTGPDLLREGRPPEQWPLERAPFFLETSVPGSFAAGDVRHNSVKRVASAVGEGAMAVTFAHRFLAETA
jgi:thioredoxin reductase (NADPH)